MRLIEAKRNKTPSPRPIILNDALPHSSRMETIPTFLLVVWFLDGSIVWGRGCPTSASDTSMSAWKYLFFSWNITEIAWMILKCQCLAIVETRLNHQFSSPMFPPFSTLSVFNQATCNLVLPAENMVDLPHRRSNNPRGLPGSVHYQLPAPANTSCTMRCSTPKARTLDPHKDVQKIVCSHTKKIYITYQISNS